MQDEEKEHLVTLLKPEEVAHALRVSPETVRRWLRNGVLGGIRLSGRRGGWRVRQDDINAFVARLRRNPKI